MKARIKETGEIVNVTNLFDDGTAEIGENTYIKVSQIDMDLDGTEGFDMPSEQRIKYELLKISIQGILSSNRLMDGIYNTSKESNIDVESIIVKTARGLTDETIKQFKENY